MTIRQMKLSGCGGVSALAICVLFGAVFAVGCTASNAGAGPWMDLPNEQPTTVPDAELFHYLITQAPTITQDQAYHAFLIWVDGKDDTANFGQRIQALEGLGVMDPKWPHHPLKPLTNGRMASMVCRKFHMKTSVMLLLFGPTERASRRELLYRNIMSAGGSDYDPMSGAEFVNVLKRADEYSPEQNVAPQAP